MCALALTVALACIAAAHARAADGIPVCVSPFDQFAPVSTPDGAGGMKKVVPKVWAYGNDNGKNRPMTLSFEDACGRVLYSAYHTEGDAIGGGGKLLAQEKALMYVLFEVSTCLVDPVIPR